MNPGCWDVRGRRKKPAATGTYPPSHRPHHIILAQRQTSYIQTTHTLRHSLLCICEHLHADTEVIKIVEKVTKFLEIFQSNALQSWYNDCTIFIGLLHTLGIKYIHINNFKEVGILEHYEINFCTFLANSKRYHFHFWNKETKWWCKAIYCLLLALLFRGSRWVMWFQFQFLSVVIYIVLGQAIKKIISNQTVLVLILTFLKIYQI